MGSVIWSDLYAMVLLPGKASDNPLSHPLTTGWLYPICRVLYYSILIMVRISRRNRCILFLYEPQRLLPAGSISVQRYDHFPHCLYHFPEWTEPASGHIPRENIFTDLVRMIYSVDTPTNVLPSIHVYNSIGAMAAIAHSTSLKKHRGVQISSYVLGILIIFSTVFLKQHSITDVIAALAMACMIYPFVYATQEKKETKLSQQLI